MQYNDTKKYIDVLDDIVKNYNTSPHRSLDNDTPEDILTGKKERPPQIKPNDKTQHQPKNEEIGKHVRYLLKKTQFQKGNVPRWSKEVYEIKAIDGGGYILMDVNTKEELPTKKYIWELQFLKDKNVVEIKKSNKNKEDEEKIYEKEKLDKKVKRIHQIEPEKKIINQSKQNENLEKKPKIREPWYNQIFEKEKLDKKPILHKRIQKTKSKVSSAWYEQIFKK